MKFKDHILKQFSALMENESPEFISRLNEVERVLDDLDNLIQKLNSEKTPQEIADLKGTMDLICLSKIIMQLKMYHDHFQKMEGTATLMMIHEYIEEYFYKKITG